MSDQDETAQEILDRLAGQGATLGPDVSTCNHVVVSTLVMMLR